MNYLTPNGDILRKICNKFPEYAVWLMTDEAKISIKDIQNLEPKI
jgi:hypothetical protein